MERERFYVGGKGFTVYKEDLGEREVQKLRDELIVRPKEMGVVKKEFPLFRESSNKIYLPRFFGLNKFCKKKPETEEAGEEAETTVAKTAAAYLDSTSIRLEGESTNRLEFVGSLRENQIPVVEAYMREPSGCGLLELPCAYGKCLARDTEILMFDETCKKVQDVCVGDLLMGDDYTPREVLTLGQGFGNMYAIQDSTNKEFTYVANEDHIISLAKCRSRNADADADADVIGEKEKETLKLNREYDEREKHVATQRRFELVDIPLKLFLKRNDQNEFCGYRVYPEKTKTGRFRIIPYGIEISARDASYYYGFCISGNRRFLLADRTVTHNTVLSLFIASLVAKKTLVIVHKEFLLNQWKERVMEFLPNARIGKIQGPVVDIDDKDIVFGMLQSLSQKVFDPSLFSSFGLTIVDEVHHISSEVFSNALFRIVTKRMLGLSATMNRKDGTSYVFKMFLGEIVYSGTNTESFDVEVRAYRFQCNNAVFNKVIKNQKDETIYSCMITKLCKFKQRTNFCCKKIIELLEENENQQIMVLAQNRSLLEDLFELLSTSYDVGFYVGGMRETDLKISSCKKIILATYSMASEALDIRTLTTLVLATPKTEIEQAVGRILRQRHATPLVLDIVDTHLPFQNQFKKRQAFYRKQGFRVLTFFE